MRRASAIAFALALSAAAHAQPASRHGDDREPQFALGARVRGLWVTPAMMSPFLATSTLMQNPSLGVELIYRRLRYDVVTSLDFSFISPADGNYLSTGHPANDDSHFVHFQDFNFLSADVSIIGHNWLTDWLEIRYGAGVGLGLVLGDVYLINNGPQCTSDNAGDLARCHPVGIDLTSPDRQRMLDATMNGQHDTSTTPHYHKSGDLPPVTVVLNVVVGLSFRLQRHWSAQLETGFRDAIFFGAGTHYWF